MRLSYADVPPQSITCCPQGQFPRAFSRYGKNLLEGGRSVSLDGAAGTDDNLVR